MWQGEHRPASGAIGHREAPHDAGAAANLTHDSLQHVVGPQAASHVFARVGHVGQRFRHAISHDPGGFVKRPSSSFRTTASALANVGAVLLGMDRFQHGRHFLHLLTRHRREHVTIQNVPRTFPICVGKELAQGFDQPQALVGDYRRTP